MKLYHGTLISGLETLAAGSRDRQGNPVLYLTDCYPYSLFYLRDREVDFVTCGVGRDGIVRYDEKFPDQLKLLYQGRAGYVYETEAAAQPGNAPGIWVCRDSVKVTGVRHIPDAYQAITEQIGRGTVEFLPYEALTPEQKRLNHAGILQYLQQYPLTPAQKAFYREHFPKAWVEAQNLLAQRG